MPMEDNPEVINDADRQIQSRLYTEAQAYAETRKESAVLNKTRATSRKKVDEMGFRTDAYQTAIRIVKDLSDRERADFMRDLKTIVGVLGKRQAELFPEEALKAAKREEQRKQKAAEEKAAAGRSPDHPRSDPASGGAGKAKGGRKPKDDRTPAQKAADRAEAASAAKAGASADGDQMIKDVAARKANEAAEQQEGNAAFQSGIPSVAPAEPATPKSQSEIAAAARATAGLN